MIFLKNKKGVSMPIIMVASILIIAIATYLMISQGGKIPGLVSTGTALVDVNDCDNDDVPNKVLGGGDQCPCIPQGAKYSEAFRGCPAGTSEEAAREDRRTCFQFITDDEGTFEEECDAEEKEEEGGKCITRCEQTKATAIELPTSKPKGSGCNDCDLTITKFSLKKGTKNLDLSKKRYDEQDAGEKLSLKVEVTVKNLAKAAKAPAAATTPAATTPAAGAPAAPAVPAADTEGNEGDIVGDFNIGVYLCREKKQDDCQPIGADGYKAAVISGLGAGEEKTETFEIEIGTNGDYCDGAGETKCWLKLKVDGNEEVRYDQGTGKFFEKQGAAEDNNVEFVFISLKGKELKEGEFTKYNAIELVINDEGGPNPKPEEISQACTGYIGQKSDSDGYTCDSEDSSCESGEFPSVKDNFPVRKGCLVVVSEEDPTSNNCGYFGAANGEVVDTMAHRPFGALKTSFVNSDGDDADNALAYPWKSKPDIGSLLCNEGYWRACTSAENNQLTIVDGAYWKCQNGHWARHSQ